MVLTTPHCPHITRPPGALAPSGTPPQNGQGQVSQPPEFPWPHGDDSGKVWPEDQGPGEQELQGQTQGLSSPPARLQPGLGRCGDAEGPAHGGAAAPAPFCPRPAGVRSEHPLQKAGTSLVWPSPMPPAGNRAPHCPIPGRTHRGPFQERPQPPAQSGPWDPRQACLLWVSFPPPSPAAWCQVAESLDGGRQAAEGCTSTKAPGTLPPAFPAGNPRWSACGCSSPTSTSVLTRSSLPCILCPNFLLLRTRYIILGPILMTSFYLNYTCKEVLFFIFWWGEGCTSQLAGP